MSRGSPAGLAVDLVLDTLAGVVFALGIWRRTSSATCSFVQSGCSLTSRSTNSPTFMMLLLPRLRLENRTVAERRSAVFFSFALWSTCVFRRERRHIRFSTPKRGVRLSRHRRPQSPAERRRRQQRPSDRGGFDLQYAQHSRDWRCLMERRESGKRRPTHIAAVNGCSEPLVEAGSSLPANGCPMVPRSRDRRLGRELSCYRDHRGGVVPLDAWCA